MRNNLIVTLCLVIYGCATTDPVTKTVVQKVEIPIPVQCKVELPDPPSFNFPKLQITQNIYEKSQALLADRKLQIGYEQQLLAALNSCIK